MKLRNKKTGEIIESACIGVFKHKSSGDCERVDTEARSLEKVLEDWEDYKPAEPLIKDEKIRRAVRAWANSFDDVDEIKASDDYKEFWVDGYLIEFERSFNDVESEHTYRRTNITELCGEEE